MFRQLRSRVRFAIDLARRPFIAAIHRHRKRRAREALVARFRAEKATARLAAHEAKRTQPQPKPFDPNAPIATQCVVDDTKAEGVPILDRQWYYRIEVEPGIWTSGRRFQNVALTRDALRKAEVAGRRCIDIGAMEGMISVLLRRRGADVTAYDRLSFSERVGFLQEKLGVRFEYCHSENLDRFTESYHNRCSPADIVIFSGVMYHMTDPFAGLLRVRSLVRTGGLMILETAAVVGSEMVAHFNSDARLYPGDNYFFPTVALLEYWLRLAALEPLDCISFRQTDPLCRVCIPCRAIQPGAGVSEWLLKSVLRLATEYSISTDPVYDSIVYRAPEGLSRRPDGSLDVLSSMTSRPPHVPNNATTELALGAIY